MSPEEVDDLNITFNGTLHEIHTELQEHMFLNPHLYESEYIKDVLYGIALPVLVGISIIANGLICTVLTFTHTNHGKESSLSFDRLLQCLSCYDIGVSILTLLICSIPTWFSGTDFVKDIFPHLVPYLIPILHMAITGSDYLNLAAAVERYLGTDRHFRDCRGSYHEGCSPKRTNFFIMVILVFTIAFNIPAFWELRTVHNEDFHTMFGNISSDILIVSEGDSVLEVVTTELRHNDVYNKMYRLMAEFLIFKVAPWMSFLILFLTLKHRIGYYNKRKIRRTLTDRQYREIQDSRVVLGITILFYLTNVLALYISFCHILLFDIENIIIALAKVSLVVNSTFKFFIYVLLSPGFRRRLCQLFGSNVRSSSSSGKRKKGDYMEATPLQTFSRK